MISSVWHKEMVFLWFILIIIIFLVFLIFLVKPQMYIIIVLDTVLVNPKKGEKLIWQTKWWTRLSFLAAAKDCGITWTTNHNKAAGCGWSLGPRVSQSQHHAMPVVGHIRCQLSVATLLAAI